MMGVDTSIRLLTLEPERGRESPNLFALPVIQHKHLEIRVIQGGHVCPRVGQKVKRFLADRKEHIHRRPVVFCVRRSNYLRVLIEAEVSSPNGYTQVCVSMFCGCVDGSCLGLGLGFRFLGEETVCRRAGSAATKGARG